MYKLILLSILLLILSCEPKKMSSNDNRLNNKISKFDSKLVNHFPAKKSGNNSDTIVNENIRKNTVGILLYEYEVPNSALDSLNKIYTKRAIAKYSSADTCLLVINKFETPKTYSESENVYIDFEKRKNLVNKNCYLNKYPIPKFLDYRFLEKNTETYLSNDFDLYILEANNSDFFEKYNLIPNPQMSDNWSNGYSKGVAISKKSKCVIFWGVIW